MIDCGGLIVAAFTHRSSRAPDPHLHTHALVMNLARGVDGRWSGLHTGELYFLRGSAGPLYDATLRAELTERLGCAFRARGNAIDVEGISNTVVRAFSRRSRQLQGEKTAMAAVPPREKDVSKSYEELVEEWRWRAHGIGVSETTLERVCDRVAPRSLAEIRVAVEQASERALRTIRAPFQQPGLLATTARALLRGAPVPVIESTVAGVLADKARSIGSSEHYGFRRPIPTGVVRARYVALCERDPEPLLRERVRDRAHERGELVLAR